MSPGAPLTRIIQAKVAVPGAISTWVPRPRLDDRLIDLIDRFHVVAVTATAGSGKTAAVRSAAVRQQRPVAWLTIGPTDAAPGRLITYLEAAIAAALPPMRGVATRALRAGLPHAEVAGLLADALQDQPLLLVIDEIERLPPSSSEAWDILEAFTRYLPEPVRLVLLSRRDLPAGMWRHPNDRLLATVGESELTFTTEEAAAALHLVGAAELDAEDAVRATGGWVTGVLFESWRLSDHVAGAGGEADPLHGYLASHVLSLVDPPDREFLISTSVLEEVTAVRAEALGLPFGARTLATLRGAHLPVSWQGQAMRCHPRFRQYLRELLGHRDAADVKTLRIAHARLLAAEGHDEDATEELLAAGASAEALATAERAMLNIVERADFGIADRWLTGLPADGIARSRPLATARLMLAIARDDYSEAVRIADGFKVGDERASLARESPGAATLMAWAYLHAARLDDARAVLDVAGTDVAVDAARAALGLADDRFPSIPPAALDTTGGPLDALVLRIGYAAGLRSTLDEPSSSRWHDLTVAPWRIAELRVAGRTEEAVELYQSACDAGVGSVALHAYIGPEALIDAGRHAEARAAINRGKQLAHRSGSLGFQMFNSFADAKLRLRVEHDTAGARAILDRAEARLRGDEFPIYREQADTWYGLALLLDGEVGPALTRLRRAVSTMQQRGRMTSLATAAVYLAEAEWRAEDEDAADTAANVALATARAQRSNHLLLQALRDFPAVAACRLDAERDADSPWHELGRALAAQDAHIADPVTALVHFDDLGPPRVTVAGEARRPRLAKTYELLAYLLQAEGHTATRDELLAALFAGRSDESARGYLRQTIHQLRHLLGKPESVTGEKQTWRLSGAVTVQSSSNHVEARLVEVARLQGRERLDATLEALAPLERGSYMPGTDAPWAERRRSTLARAGADARHDASEIAFHLGLTSEALRLTAAVLQDDPFRESTWRLRMRVIHSLGDEDRVISTYQSCERALAELGVKPAQSTRALLDQLRR